ncbi:phosphatidylinositol 4-kinase [Heterostelium album PN500]|uniref:1-phosphatidylinositol 4-kinase n=1 Tax=Heterostelium pallidum (strain ATCC 26659 / Pp 5 / PN500) TaxID=670386 RepID=D3B1R9_HETP5|nr:phosphatidylinositol 4-kinase [Heterostelium album PN500]EFA85243.1 phosphatidylinositol 4-kinase [Heterostelium album PN500]|eukprot:XP_020437352.1 phosphatidylinositol 4-kinase [Heterostelium album PN500]
MSSSLNLSSNEFQKLNETVPELFRLSAKVQLAETISFLSPKIPEESVQILINACLSLLPNASFKDAHYNDANLRAIINSNPTLSTSLVSIRSQESVIALAHLYKCSNAVIDVVNDDKIVVPLLVSFLVYLTYTDFTNCTPADAEHATNFTYYLVGQLALLSHVSQEARNIIVPSFIEFLHTIVSSTQINSNSNNSSSNGSSSSSSNQTTNTIINPPLLYGTLKALGSDQYRFNYLQEELDKLITTVESLITQLQQQPKSTSTSLQKINQKRLFLLIFRSFEQITRLPQDQVGTDIYRKLYNVVLPYTSSSNLIDNETFISIINVIVRCAINDASIGPLAFDFILRYIAESKSYSNSEVISAMQRPFTESLYATMLTSLVTLTDKYPDKVIKVIDSLKDFIIGNSLVVKHSDAVRAVAFDSICKILKNEQQREQMDVVRSVISSFVNTLHANYANGSGLSTSTTGIDNRLSRSPSVLAIHNDSLSNIIVCLGRMICTLNDINIIYLLLPVFISRVTYPPAYIDNLILEQLTDIALLGHEAIIKDIVQMITKLFKKIYKDPNQVNIDDLEQNISSPILKGMGFLLPTIAELVKQPIITNYNSNNSSGSNSNQSLSNSLANSVSTSSNSLLGNLNGSSSNVDKSILNSGNANMKLFRSVWFYCVLFKFSVPGQWRSDWRDSVQVIASHLAPLISSKTFIYLEMEIELDSIIKQGFDKEYFVNLRQTLNELLPGHAHFIKQLTNAQVAYVYCVHTLETMRYNESHSFTVIFSYLEDQGVENINVTSCIRGIADRVFNEFLMTYSVVSPSICERELSTHARFLLVKFCYPYEPVRKAADEWISSLVAKFPSILWNKDCLSTLLDLLDVIGQAARTKPMDMISTRMPNTGEVIELPDETPSRQRLLQEVIELGNVWLKNGAAVAPAEIAEQLQEYMQKFSQIGQNHIGFSLAVEIGSIQSSSNNGSVSTPTTPTRLISSGSTNANSSTPSIANSNAATFVSTLQLKALYTGEVNGMINMMMMDENENSGDAEETERIVEELAFLRLIEEFRKRKSINIGVFSSIMYRSCAFLINRYFGQSIRLIHMVCYTPVIIFTPESMEVGITAWKWLLAERPDLTRFIMTSISDIWSWTVNQRIGLFSNTEREPSPLSISNTGSGSDATGNPGSAQVNVNSSTSSTSGLDQSFAGLNSTMGSSQMGSSTANPQKAKKQLEKNSHIPHRTMIKFLEERFSIVRFSSKEQIDIIAQMLQKALSDPLMLSVSPKSLGTRFSLLLLCMKFVQGDHISDASSAMLLRKRVYLAALSWFYMPPIWYGLNESSGELNTDTKTLIDFCKALQHEPLFAHLDKRFTINFRDRSNTTVPTSSSATYSVNSISGVGGVSGAGGVGTSTPTGTNSTLGFNSVRHHRGGSDRITSGIINPQALNGVINQSVSGGTVSQNSGSISVNGTNGLGGTYSQNELLSVRMDVIGSGIGTMSSANSYHLSQSLIDSMKADKPWSNDIVIEDLRKQRNLILLLVGNELERMSAWNNPINRISLQIPEQLKFSYDNLPKSIKSTWKEYLVSAWRINPRLAIQFNSRFPQNKIRRILSEMVVKNTKSVLNIPEALPLLVTEENVKANIPELKYLLYWETVTPPAAIALLGRSYHSHPLVSQYACRVLRNFSPETIMFYIPQLVQALRYDRTGLVEQYLVNASKTSELLAHQIIWNVQTYTEADPNTGKMIDDPQIQDVAKRLKERIISEMDPSTLENYESEFRYFESFTAISGRLLQLKDPTKRKGQLKDELKTLQTNHNNDPDHPLYLPTNPKNIVEGLEIDTAMTLQSAAKVPILVNFKVKERVIPAANPTHMHVKSPSPSNSPPNTNFVSSTSTSKVPEMLKNQFSSLAASSSNLSSSIMRSSSNRLQKQSSRKVIQEQEEKPSNQVTIQGCIFKSGDDIRQDMLALQVIDLFKRIFKSAGLDLFLFPYKVIATKPGCGMIELCPNTMSRDQIGKKVNGSLYNYFISRYGAKNSIGFQNARRNFIKSMAAYSVVSYILQIKDRHNANILVDEEGHIIHIDFGFIFDISPGGDMITFEASPFKMSQEMIDIMGGKPNAEQFTWFMEQSVRAFLAARQHMETILTLVELMLDTKLPCFKEQTLLHLKQRFCPGKSDTYAAKYMSKVVVDSFSRLSTFSTYFYDVFQYYDNGIEM